MKKIIENILYSHNYTNLKKFEIDLNRCSDTRLKIDSKLNMSSFLEGLNRIKENYIIESDKVTTDIDSRRIAILITECYLKNGGDVYKADGLERNIYEGYKSLCFECSPIPEEIRLEEEFSKRGKRKKKKDVKKKALRLGIETSEKVLVKYQDLTYFVINKLMRNEGETKDEQSRSETRESTNSKGYGKNIPSRERYTKILETRKENALRETRIENILFGTKNNELARKNKRRKRKLKK